MPSDKFPGPSYDQVKDTDPQIKRVDLDNMEIAARPSVMPKKQDEGMAIRHVNGKN